MTAQVDNARPPLLPHFRHSASDRRERIAPAIKRSEGPLRSQVAHSADRGVAGALRKADLPNRGVAPYRGGRSGKAMVVQSNGRRVRRPPYFPSELLRDTRLATPALCAKLVLHDAGGRPMTTARLHFTKATLGWFAYFALIGALLADAFR
jgi:hypothetical protein